MIACVALLLGAGGVAYGTARATGQSVNVVDPTTAANAAKVDGSGALRVKQAAGTSFSCSVSTANFYASGFTLATVPQTTTTLSADRLALSIEDSGASPWDGALWYEVGSATTCSGALRRLAVEAAAPGQRHLDSFQQPLQLGPDAAGHVWCLKASSGPFDVSSDGTSYVDVSATIVKGTLSPPIGAATTGTPSTATGG